MEAWVIKRNDGDYLSNPDYDIWTEYLYAPLILGNKKEARTIIKLYDIKNAKPVKIRIEEVGDEK